MEHLEEMKQEMKDAIKDAFHDQMIKGWSVKQLLDIFKYRRTNNHGITHLQPQ